VPSAKIPVVGFLSSSTEASTAGNLRVFREGMQSLGYTEGQNLRLETRYAGNAEDPIHEMAAELVRLPVDVIVTGGLAGITAAQRATSTIPIVFGTAGDPVAQGFVESLARPGRNVTGLTQLAGTEHARRLQILKEVVPMLSRVAVLTSLDVNEGLRQIEQTAPSLGVQLLPVALDAVADPEPLIRTARDAGAADSWQGNRLIQLHSVHWHVVNNEAVNRDFTRRVDLATRAWLFLCFRYRLLPGSGARVFRVLSRSSRVGGSPLGRTIPVYSSCYTRCG
jgi:putative ABC transport system substrate-binding protein